MQIYVGYVHTAASHLAVHAPGVNPLPILEGRLVYSSKLLYRCVCRYTRTCAVECRLCVRMHAMCTVYTEVRKPIGLARPVCIDSSV